MELDRIALDLGNEEVVLDLLNERVQDERGDDHTGADGRREEHGRHGRDDRADDRDQLQHASDHREKDGVPSEDGVHQVARHDEANEGEDRDGEPEDQLAANPLTEDPLDGSDHGPHVEPPAGRQGSVELRHQDNAVVEQVGDPDRQDEVAEDDPDQASGAGQHRQQERQVDGDGAPGVAEPGQDSVDPVADRGRDVEARIQLAQMLDLTVQVGSQRWEVGDEAEQLVDQGRHRDQQELDDDQDRAHVDHQNGQRSRQAVAGEPAHRWIEQIDEQQADDERPDTVRRQRREPTVARRS